MASLFDRLAQHGQAKTESQTISSSAAARPHPPSGGKDCSANDGSVLIKTIKPGDLVNHPTKNSRCSIHYESFLEHTNNEAFDSSWDRGQELAFIFGKGQLIEGLEIAVSEMSVGQRVEARIPHHLAYGVKGYPPVIPPRATLVYRVELMSVSP